jgi:hypothetical protein
MTKFNKSNQIDNHTDYEMEFSKEGYCLFPEIFNQAQLASLRDTLINLFDKHDSRYIDIANHYRMGSIIFDVLNRVPDLAWLVGHPPLVKALSALLGDGYVVMPDATAHNNGFGDWHKDTTSQECAGQFFHKQENYRQLTVAIYLQDNGPNGGGADVIPRTQFSEDRYVIKRKGFFGKLQARFLQRFPKVGAFTVPSKAGDLVVFDLRLDHKASWPKIKGPETQCKLAIFFTASRNNEHALNLAEYRKTRPSDCAYLKDYQYSTHLVNVCKDAGVTLLPVELVRS